MKGCQERLKNFIAEPFAYHEEVKVKVESLTNLGMGVGRVNGCRDGALVVPARSSARIVICKLLSGFTEVLEASPDRVEPVVRSFRPVAVASINTLNTPGRGKERAGRGTDGNSAGSRTRSRRQLARCSCMGIVR